MARYLAVTPLDAYVVSEWAGLKGRFFKQRDVTFEEAKQFAEENGKYSFMLDCPADDLFSVVNERTYAF